MLQEPAIFISYRRTDAGGHGRNLHEYLSGRFGNDSVFFDGSTIESGDVFADTLRRGVEACAVLLALIGPEWLDVCGDDGGRRLDDADDFVRREIALALELGKKVIPVLFDDTPVPSAEQLPDLLKPLASRDALRLRGKTYEYQTQRRELVRLLAKVPGVPKSLPEAGAPGNLHYVPPLPGGLIDRPIFLQSLKTSAGYVPRPAVPGRARGCAAGQPRPPVLRVGHPPRHLDQRRFTALLIQILEPVEAVAGKPHDPAGLADAAELPRQLEHADLVADDLLVPRHRVVSSPRYSNVYARRRHPTIATCQI